MNKGFKHGVKLVANNTLSNIESVQIDNLQTQQNYASRTYTGNGTSQDIIMGDGTGPEKVV